ncbi:alpha/beta fold hydrolase [Myceligenerans indicum]|uniref:Alpha/beta hydrolase n=1 Tax=Myceligenerans indicum TaxID=2593663 RepID=A0ABS1LQR1_9MICO|nr:alpha/beta hydrolase [Myceligenerans indicum]MBL0888631.1 alpha/beta hydrolase [Myceligenerans indicum]
MSQASISGAARPSPSSHDVPTRSVRVGDAEFAYRELGPRGGTPVILLHHLAANLDDWDPRLIDGLAATRHVIAFDNRGVGASTGSTPQTVEAMAADAVAFVRALGHERVDLFGFSLGGFVAQAVLEREPALVRRAVLAGTGPAGGPGIDKIRWTSIVPTIKALVRRKHPKYHLFFTGTATGRAAAQAFLDRLQERTEDRDGPVANATFSAQMKAIHRWGKQSPWDLSRIGHPVLLANGETDAMVPSRNTIDLADRLPHGELVPLYPDAGHGGIFQHHTEFTAAALEFLERAD